MKGLSKTEIKLVSELEFEEKYFFTSEDVDKIARDKTQRYNIIKNLIKKGRIEKLNMTKYYLIPIKAKTGKWSEWSFIIADEIMDGKDYFIGGWSAANYWNLTEQVPMKTEVYSTRRQGIKKIISSTFIFRRTSLRRLRYAITKTINGHKFRILNKKGDRKMAIKNRLIEREIDNIVATTGFRKELIIKDYYITILLYLMKDIKGIYFKGGTALQKTILDYARLSEDIDLTLNKPLKEVIKEIAKVINESKIFGEISQDKDIDKFVRLVVPYKSGLGEEEIFIDLNERGKILLKPESLEMKHFYPNIPKFSFPCLNQKEMVAEKVAAAIGRNKPRDHYDIYQLIKHNITFDMDLVKKKCKKSGDDPSIIKMFNKAKTLHKRWNQDMIPLLVDEVSFQEVMQTLAKHFDLKIEKENIKNTTSS